MSFLLEYDTAYAPLLGRRTDTFRTVFKHLLDVKSSDITVVETGMINDPGNWAGHGQSTVLFDRLIKHTSGRVFSVDTSVEAIAATRKLVSDNTLLICGNSLNFLRALSQPIDLLYLDSWDLDHNDPMPSAQHHLFEMAAAAKNLHPGSIVCIDDTWWPDDQPPFGKGMALCEYMKQIKAERITSPDGIQVAWILK